MIRNQMWWLACLFAIGLISEIGKLQVWKHGLVINASINIKPLNSDPVPTQFTTFAPLKHWATIQHIKCKTHGSVGGMHGAWQWTSSIINFKAFRSKLNISLQPMSLAMIQVGQVGNFGASPRPRIITTKVCFVGLLVCWLALFSIRMSRFFQSRNKWFALLIVWLWS